MSCNCATSRLFPHRANKCALRKAAVAIAPGINVRNESDVPVLFVLSQLSPLHWNKINPGEKKHIDCGKVFFTASVQPYTEEDAPTEAGVALRIGAITAAYMLGTFWLVGGLSAVTSACGTKMDGFYADGRTVVIRGRVNDSNVYELYFHALEL